MNAISTSTAARDKGADGASGLKGHDAILAGVSDVCDLVVNENTLWFVQLLVVGGCLGHVAGNGQNTAIGSPKLYPVVPGVRDIQTARAVDKHTTGLGEVALRSARSAARLVAHGHTLSVVHGPGLSGDDNARRRCWNPLDDPVISAICDIELARGGDVDATGVAELIQARASSAASGNNICKNNGSIRRVPQDSVV
eukprot:CAMPEP_0176147232 /NCGR_PEP_ID=MMETSP0120_2-20121206/75055_1 /TAXON_ID=160619 /ORGANISM="Kryptoperidinium foliaceum, Strain CCMP 1326" /LENGTH=196 /DNA_ID=CAMNT_0017483843 /DNA_START=416 /DNA_END=1006 /DNA_ORIENTATION=+